MKNQANLTERAKQFLEGEVAVSMQNLEFCRRLSWLLREYAKMGKRPEATLQIRGSGPQPTINSNNCGFVATPVIFNAVIDIRKFTSFFGFNGTLKRRRKDTDDFDVFDLGLPYPSYNEFITSCLDPTYSRTEFEDALRFLLRYGNKLIAHFTESFSGTVLLEYKRIDVACIGISKAVHGLIYDALKLPHPNIRFSEVEST